MVRPTLNRGKLPPLTATYADSVLRFISDLFNYSQGSLLSRSRDQDRALIRQLTIWLVAETSDGRLADLAYVVGRRDHRTATQAIEKINRVRLREVGFDLLCRRLLERLSRDHPAVDAAAEEVDESAFCEQWSDHLSNVCGEEGGPDRAISLEPLSLPNPEAIIAQMAEAFGYSMDELVKLSDHDCQLIRQLAIWLASEASPFGRDRISQIIGREDYRAVLRAVENIDKLRRSERGFRSLTNRLLLRAESTPEHS